MPKDLSRFTTKEMASEAKLEVMMRERLYRRRVTEGKMSPAQADDGIDLMKAIQFKLEWLERNESAQGDLFQD